MHRIARRFVTYAVSALALTLATARNAAAQDLAMIGSGLGSFNAHQCPSGSLLTGIRARRGLTVDAIGIRCRPVRSDGTLGAESDVGTVWGGTGGTTFAQSCGSGTVIAAQVAKFNGLILTDVTYLCYRWRPSSRTFDPNDVGVAIYVVPDGGATGVSYGAGTMTRCPSTSSPGRSIRTRVTTVVSTIGLRCGSPS